MWRGAQPRSGSPSRFSPSPVSAGCCCSVRFWRRWLIRRGSQLDCGGGSASGSWADGRNSYPLRALAGAAASHSFRTEPGSDYRPNRGESP
jgi:hypothetical protein